MKHAIRHYYKSLPFSCLRFAVGLWCFAEIFGSGWCVAAPVAGTNVFTRPLNAGVAISVQVILSKDSDTALIPLFVGGVNTNSTGGGVISRTNDWLYYQPPASLVVTDSFNYVLTNLLQQAATGTVTIVATRNFVPTNVLTISTPAPGTEQIQFFGNVGSYSLLSSSNLQAWQTVAARLAWPTGYFQLLITNAGSGQSKNFYRTANGALAPAITNYQANGTANVQVDFNLGVEGGFNSPYPATIESLPTLGYLFQDDGSVISNVPAPVTSANGSLHYFGPPSGTGPDHASFRYKITRSGNGLDSLPATFQLSLAPDVPVSTTPNQIFPEDIGGLIQLTGSDPDLRYPSNHLQFEVEFTPIIGTLYQVKQDGTTDLTNVIQPFTYVSNTNGWIYYQPPALRYGTPFDSITFFVQNSFNIQSEAILLPISVYFVNHPPTASDVVVSGRVDDEPLQPIPDYSDPDFNATTICFASLPARGRLYLSGTVITASNNCFPLSLIPTLQFYSNSRTNGQPCYPDGTDIGSPYATATYFITDSDGASSTTNTITFNVLPLQEPISIPSGPTDYTNLVNMTNTIVFPATNSTGPVDMVLVDLRTVPTHGQLYLGTHLLSTTPTTLPANPVLVYQPNAGYYSSRDGLDSFAYRVFTPYDESQCDTIITLHVFAPPVISKITGPGTIPVVTVNSSGVVVNPAAFTNFTVAAFEAGTNAILQVTVAGSPVGSAPYGVLTLNSTNGLTDVQTNGPCSLQLYGTAAALTSALAGGMHYYSTPSSSASVITATLNDFAVTGFGTNISSVFQPVLYTVIH